MTLEKYGCVDAQGHQTGPLYESVIDARMYARRRKLLVMAYTFTLSGSEPLDDFRDNPNEEE
jgi:hypothetical protein